MKRHTAVVLIAALLSPTIALAQSSGCDAKRQSIQTELDYAQAHGNTARVQGLQKAQAEINAHCTDAFLREAAQQKVAKAQEKLTARQNDLQQAQNQGKSAKKIADRQHKVDAAHADLEQAMMDATQMP